MRVSEFFRLRFWSAGLLAVASVGHYTIPVSALVPPVRVQEQQTAANDKIESWLRDAQNAMQQNKWDSAFRSAQVAEALCQSEGVTSPEVLNRLKAIQEQIATHRGTGSGPLAPSPLSPNPVAPAAQGTGAQSMEVTSGLNHLLQARRALAQGDVTTAQTSIDAARKTGVDFTGLKDSPTAVEALITRQNELAQMARTGDADQYNNSAAKFLLQQAETLLNYGELATSESLAKQAAQFPAEYGDSTLTPQLMLTRIEAARTAPAANPQKAEVSRLMSEARLAIDQQKWVEAAGLVSKAKAVGLAENEFASNEMRPWQLELIIDKAIKQKGLSGAVQTEAVASSSVRDMQVQQAGYDPAQDNTRNAVVGFDQTKKPAASGAVGDSTLAMEMYRSGLAAMDQNDNAQAREYFEMAWNSRESLDSGTQKAIQDKMVALSSATSPATVLPKQDPEEIDLSNMGSDEEALFRGIQKEVFEGRASADRLMRTDPRQALDLMLGMRNRVSQSKLSSAAMGPLLTIIDRDINEAQKFIQENLPEIMNDETNAERKEGVELEQERRYEVEFRLQQLTEEFNKLVDQRRFAEAEMLARQANDLAPGSEIASVMLAKAKMVNSVETMKDLGEIRTDMQQLEFGPNMERAATVMDTSVPYQYGDGEEWNRRTQERLEQLNLRKYRSEEERRIWNALTNQVIQGEFRGSLSEAVDQLSSQTGINIAFDSMALRTEGIDVSTTAVAQTFSQPISMKSALNVLLGSVGLTFVVEDEVIKITSRDGQRKQVKSEIYYVGDLVSPVVPPNSPSQMNFITPNQQMNTQNTVLAQNMPGNGMMNVNQMATNPTSGLALAQQMPGGQGLFGDMGNAMMAANLGGYNGGGGAQRGTPIYTTNGAPQLGGITLQDFTPLISLIQATIAPDDWQTTQGEGTIMPYVPNLSLIVSQTQEVHDEIQDLLTQLRKLNDVQIVVEVRFINLSDNFFERIGVDFDFKINDSTGLTPQQVLNQDSFKPSVIVGRDQGTDTFNPTPDLDIGFFQNSIGSTVPTFGGFDPGTAANFGFAILSDIEVFFLIQASKGDQRTNLTQAPTVTMFNGQSASITDVSQRPFVTSVIPVVGDFAVAQQPIVSILPEGASLNVSAVASDDRRFVRLSMVPYFTEITDVQTFTFEGSRTTRRTNSSFLQDLLSQISGTPNTNDDPDLETESTGTTIQQPVLAVTSISTVVSVPDGGTVLLGGIKRLRERRIERGVPFLSNIPYVNRLFKNVGIGRETTNLMMMVTPKIIIQEEEERKQVGPIGGN